MHHIGLQCYIVQVWMANHSLAHNHTEIKQVVRIPCHAPRNWVVHNLPSSYMDIDGWLRKKGYKIDANITSKSTI